MLPLSQHNWVGQVSHCYHTGQHSETLPIRRGGYGRGRGRRGGDDEGPSLFTPSLASQAASVAEGLARLTEARSVLQIGGLPLWGAFWVPLQILPYQSYALTPDTKTCHQIQRPGYDGGDTLTRLLRSCAFTPLTRLACLDWVMGRLGRTARAVEAAVSGSAGVLGFVSEEPGGRDQAGAAETASLRGAGSLSALSVVESCVGSEGGQPSDKPEAAADSPVGASGPAAPQPRPPWRAEVALLQGDLNTAALASPAGWTASGLPGCDLVAMTDAIEQLGSPDDAAAAVGGHVLGGLEPKMLLITTPNR
jgi:hypothetical protein